MTTQDDLRKTVALAQRRLRDNRDLNRTERAVAIRLLGFVQTGPDHARFGLAWPSQTTLAVLEDCSDRTIRRAIKKLRGVYFDVTYTSSHGGSHAAFYTPIWVALMGVIDNPDAEQPQAPAASVQEVEVAVKPDIKPDKTAVETGQNCPPISSTDLRDIKHTPKSPLAVQAGTEKADIQILDEGECPLDLLSLAEIEKLIERFYPNRKARRGNPYRMQDLKRRRGELLVEIAEAEAASAWQEAEQEHQRETSLREARQQMEEVLERKCYQLHHKFKSGGMREQLDAWLRLEAEQLGSGMEDMQRCIDSFWERFKANTAARRAA